MKTVPRGAVKVMRGGRHTQILCRLFIRRRNKMRGGTRVCHSLSFGFLSTGINPDAINGITDFRFVSVSRREISEIAAARGRVPGSPLPPARITISLPSG